jgi:hypothetical protein
MLNNHKQGSRSPGSPAQFSFHQSKTLALAASANLNNSFTNNLFSRKQQQHQSHPQKSPSPEANHSRQASREILVMSRNNSETNVSAQKNNSIPQQKIAAARHHASTLQRQTSSSSQQKKVDSNTSSSKSPRTLHVD